MSLPIAVPVTCAGGCKGPLITILFGSVLGGHTLWMVANTQVEVCVVVEPIRAAFAYDRRPTRGGEIDSKVGGSEDPELRSFVKWCLPGRNIVSFGDLIPPVRCAVEGRMD
ncbi:hypothetical protein BC826DRAFT_972927 [Russula brevipes]|nr:hypothetical protein BC826DRAFT_972927 [Russula brevipes]